MPITRSRLQNAIVSVDYGVLDTIDALRYAFGERLTFRTRTTMDAVANRTHSSSSTKNPDISPPYLATEPDSQSEVDDASDKEEDNLLQLSTDDSATSAFPVLNTMSVQSL